MIKFRSSPAVDTWIVINAPSDAVFKAFFDHDALGVWWRADRSVTTPRVLGPYVAEWRPSDQHDELLGRLGGVLRGTIMHLDEGSGFFAADVYWLPPDGHPIGPMALDVSWKLEVGDEGQISTRVRVRQKGFEESPRWRRYYELTQVSWDRALASLRTWLEGRSESGN
jgi:hypothetical protein